jgi:hypothetical protein
MRSNHLRRIAERSLAIMARQAGSAACAAAMARRGLGRTAIGHGADQLRIGGVVDVDPGTAVRLDPLSRR